MRGRTLSFVIPVYNSERTIAALVGQLESLFKGLYDFNIVLVDDGSSDGSARVLRELSSSYDNVLVISLSRNFGQHCALMAGLRHADGDYVVTMDDDMQHRAGEALKLLDAIEKGYDVMYGAYKVKKHSLIKNIGSELNNLMADVIIKKPRSIRFTSFRALRRYVVQEIARYDGPYPYIDGLIVRVTRNIGTVEVAHSERALGRSHYTFKKLFSLWMNGLLNFSVDPLRLSSFFGFASASLGFAAAVYLLFRALFYDTAVEGWTSIIVATLLFSGVLLLSMGIMGEYVGRIFLTLNRTPQYVIKEIARGSPKPEIPVSRTVSLRR